MVQMGDAVAADRVIRFLNKVSLFGKEVQMK